jgi:hypothetical protein
MTQQVFKKAFLGVCNLDGKSFFLFGETVAGKTFVVLQLHTYEILNTKSILV